MGQSFIDILGVGVFLYLIWRNLRDDYPNDELIVYSWWCVLGWGMGGRLAYGLLHWGVWNDSWSDWLNFWQMKGFSLPGAYLGWILASMLYAKIKGWKLMYVLEDGVGITWMLILLLLAREVVAGGFTIERVWSVVVALMAVVASYWWRGRYRSLWWYRSGRKGFVFWVVNFWVGIGYALEAIVFKWGIGSVGLMLIWSLQSVVGLVILGDERRKR